MKIKKALIIRRLQVDASMKYAQECAESCEKFNVPYEFIDAIEFVTAEEAYKSVGTFINNYTDWEMSHNAHCCCHASHIKCWQYIADCGEACLVLEHDAIVKAKIDKVGVTDMTLVTFGLRVKDPNDYTPPTGFDKLIRIRNAIGGHAYAMTPKTAEFILEDIKTNGVNTCIDTYLMMQRRHNLPLFICEPPLIVCYPRISTNTYNEKKLLNKEFVEGQFLADYENEPNSITPGWIRGLMKNKKPQETITLIVGNR